MRDKLIAQAITKTLWDIAVEHEDEVQQLKQKIEQLETANSALWNEVRRSHRELCEQIDEITNLEIDLDSAYKSLTRVLSG